jgi:hypothetical protein
MYGSRALMKKSRKRERYMYRKLFRAWRLQVKAVKAMKATKKANILIPTYWRVYV